MKELDKNEVQQIREVAQEMSQAITQTVMGISRDKRVAILATMKVTAGLARAANMDLHRAIQMFMTYYKDADKHFKKLDAKERNREND